MGVARRRKRINREEGRKRKSDEDEDKLCVSKHLGSTSKPKSTSETIGGYAREK